MSHNDEHTPIRERWTARPAGQDDEATAGALLRTAAEHGPLGEKRLAEIHARLRRSRRAKAFPRPAPRLLRHLVFAAGFVLCAGVLSASVMHVMRRPPKQPEVAPAPAAESHKKTPRRPVGKRAPVEVVTPAELPAAPEPPVPSAAPAAQAPEPVVTPPAASAPPATPAPSPKIQAQASAPRSSGSQRRIAIRETPSLMPTVAPLERPVPSPIVTSAASAPAKPSSPLAPAALPLPPIPQAPLERPAPALPPAPVLPAPTPVRQEPSRLARESRWLASAIAKLRQEGQPEQALAILDQHRAELGSGVLSAEANATRIEALLRLGRNGQALDLLDGQRLSAQGLGREMLVARGELRAEKGRTSPAISDFDLILSSPGRVDGITERALYGRATCRAKSGDRDGARGDFQRYLTAFPQGRFASEARSALSSQVR